MTEDSRGSIEAREERGFAPPDAPGESPADKLLVGRPAEKNPQNTHLDGFPMVSGPQSEMPPPPYGETPRYQDAPPRFEDARPAGPPPPYSDGPPAYSEQGPPAYSEQGPPSYKEQGPPSYGDQQPPQRPGFAPHGPGAFWPGTQPQNTPPPQMPGMNGPGGPGGPNWAPVPPPPAAPRRAPGMGLFVGIGLAIALIAGTVGAGVTALATQDDQPQATSLGGPIAGGDAKDKVRDPQSVAGIAQRVLPSVVTVKLSLGNGEGGSGTGFVVKDGYIITNNHVVASMSAGASLKVVFHDGKESNAVVKGTSPANDVAVLKPDTTHDLPPLELGNSDTLQVGDQVIAIGSPLGLEGSVTTGIISAKDRLVPTRSESGDQNTLVALQTDAAINPGNSGGPLVDGAGKVIGVNTAIASLGATQGSEQSGSIGLGFALPINKVRIVAEELIKGNAVKKTIIGISMDRKYSENGGEGVKIAGPADTKTPVTPGGPAEKAGLRAGDVITSVDGKAIVNPEDLLGVIAVHKPGDVIKVTFRRGAQESTVDVTLAEGKN